MNYELPSNDNQKLFNQGGNTAHEPGGVQDLRVAQFEVE
jgi:hypothetical protein